MRSALSAAAALCVACGAVEPEAPVQPIPFSHKLHVTDNQIGCTLCHAYAARGPVAGIPSDARCNGCHKFVGMDKPVIQKINQAFAKNEPLVWQRVYWLPDMVFFTHERHVAAGLRCQQCHGPVETMTVTRREAPLTMGWCLDCHLAKHAPTDCLTCHK